MIDRSASANLRHLGYLDGWRGLAIAFLLIGHFFPVPGINLGTVGVNLFFVLSGYLMGQLLFIKETKIPVFYRRRISRIIPTHVFFILCVTGYFAATGRGINWQETFAALFFVNNYFSGELGNNVMPFGHIWSLSVEEHSYLVLSLVALLSRKRWGNAQWLIGSLTVCFSVTGFWYWSHYAGRELEFGKWLHSEVSAYGIFMSAFLLVCFTKAKFGRVHFLLTPSLLLFGMLLHWWSVSNPVRTTLGVGAFALAVNLLPNAPEKIKQVLSFMPLRMLGLGSFSIYLWQQPFYLAVHAGSIPRNLGIVLAILCGALSYYFLERPVRSYLNAHWGPIDVSRRSEAAS